MGKSPDKRPWRELTALLGFLAQQQTQGFNCLQLNAGIHRATGVVDSFTILVRVVCASASNAGEQYASGSDDFVESTLWLHSATLGEFWICPTATGNDGP